jgi:hypothetical protein
MEWMANKTYLLQLKGSQPRLHTLVAASVQVHSDHLAFLGPDGKLVFLVLLELIESWNEI